MDIIFYTCLLTLLGASFGSFANVVIYRLPKIKLDDDYDGTLSKPRSACPGCETPIKWHRNIPLLSWLWLRARCPDCQAKIPARYFLVELFGAMAGLGSALFISNPVFACCLTLFLICLLVISLIDLEHGYIFHETSLAVLLTGLIASASVGSQWLEYAAISAFIGFAMMFTLYWGYRLIRKREGMGGGDVALVTGLAAWVGWHGLPILLIVAGSLFIVTALIAKRANKPMPFGPFLCLGALAALVA